MELKDYSFKSFKLTDMRLLILFFLVFSIQNLFAQSPEQYLNSLSQPSGGKPPIDFKAIDSWTRLKSDVPLISNNGKWFSYKIVKGYSPYQSETLVVQSTDGNWVKIFPSASPCVFSGDNRIFLAKIGDSLCLFQLGSSIVRCVENVESYQINNNSKPYWIAWQLKNKIFKLHRLSSNKEKTIKDVASYTFSPTGEWLACKLEDGSLLLHELATGKEKSYPEVNAYAFTAKDKVLILKTKSANAEGLLWIDLVDDKKHIAFAENNPNRSIVGFATDFLGQQLTFSLQEKKNEGISNSIWYYKPDMESAMEKVNDQSTGIEKGLFVEAGANFTDNGKYIQFKLKGKPNYRKANPSAVKIDVWNYKDSFLQSAQLLWPEAKESMQPQPYLTLVNINTKEIIQLGGENIKPVIQVRGDYALVKRFISGDRFWENNWCDSVYLVSLRSAKRVFLKKAYNNISFSPNSRHLLYFDENEGQYYSYQIETNRWQNISAKVSTYLGSENAYDPPVNRENGKTGIAGWSKDGENLYVYDTYDLWKLDIHGIKEPVNVTAGYGRKHNLIMRLTAGNSPHLLEDGVELLFTVFNVDNKENGFYSKVLGKTGKPEKLFMGPCIVDLQTANVLPFNAGSLANSVSPIKAREASIWLVRKETEQNGGNYYLTRDFKNLRQLTDIRTHQNYNWYTTELVNFKQVDGTKSQGVLFKPENFDPNKKYPLIIHYYWQFTQELHHCFEPYYTPSGWIDIPWFVSRGYLVFTPDIYFTKETRPAGAFNAVEGSATYLSRLPYVDSTKMGIAGHSRAGGYTNYILTHSKRFAAVFEGAGVSDWVSAQLQLISTIGIARGDFSQQEPYLAGDKKVFSENPIMNVEEIRSPLLMYHCKKDGAVPFEQAVELFLAMRRLNKKVWLLQYDNGSHDVGDEKKDQQDLTIRVTQFFDHYLKGAPAPHWMLKGVPAHLKGIETGLELGDPKAQP
jgi:dipeptidyl aminopeptidase/acylaminoacyl peptidase